MGALAVSRAGIPERVAAEAAAWTLEARQQRVPGAQMVKKLYRDAHQSFRTAGLFTLP